MLNAKQTPRQVIGEILTDLDYNLKCLESSANPEDRSDYVQIAEIIRQIAEIHQAYHPGGDHPDFIHFQYTARKKSCSMITEAIRIYQTRFADTTKASEYSQRLRTLVLQVFHRHRIAIVDFSATSPRVRRKCDEYHKSSLDSFL